MKKSSFEDTFQRFFYWMVWYTDFLEKVTYARRVISQPEEKRELFEAFVLKIHVTWEVLVEDLLIDCLNRDTSKYAQYTNRDIPKHLARDVCEALICGLGFFDIKGIGQLKGIANNIIVTKYNPFNMISGDDGKKIDEFYKIRNYLAHYSERSRQSLLKMYKSDYGLKTFREPGDFLFAFDKVNKRIRLINYISSFFSAGDDIAVFLGI